MRDVEQHEAEQAREHARGEHGALGGELLGAAAEREARDQDAHGEADAAEHAHAEHLPPVGAFRQGREADLYQQRRHRHDAQRLAEHKAKKNALRHRVGKDACGVHPDQAQLRVGEGEQRQDEEVHGRGDGGLDALQRRRHAVHDVLHASGGLGEPVLAEHVELGVVGVVELPAAVAQPVLDVLELDVRLHGQEEREDDAGKRRVDARVEHAEPQHKSKGDVPAGMVDLQPGEAPQRKADRGGGGKPRQARRLAVEQRDHDDAEQVVGDGERREEHLGRRRDLIARERHDAEREGDVGGDGHGPAALSPAPVEQRVDKGGGCHAAARGEDGHHGLPRIGEDACRELVLELDADAQEEDRHEKVVDKALERHRADVGAHLDGQGRLKERADGVVRVGVRNDHGEHGGGDHRAGGDGAVVRYAREALLVFAAPHDGGHGDDGRGAHGVLREFGADGAWLRLGEGAAGRPIPSRRLVIAQKQRRSFVVRYKRPSYFANDTSWLRRLRIVFDHSIDIEALSSCFWRARLSRLVSG